MALLDYRYSESPATGALLVGYATGVGHSTFAGNLQSMLWLNEYINKIQSLMNEGTPESLTYAALECRLAIERVCYERLRIAHDYISHDDIRKWQPKDVVKTLIQEVDSHIASTVTLSISQDPVGDKAGDFSQEDFEKLKYKKIGTQVGFCPKKLGKLWNACSSFLHVKIPKVKSDRVGSYGDQDALERKLEEVLIELESLAKGTLIMSGMGETVSFRCNCDATNKRRVLLLKDKQLINCINPACFESWEVEFDGDDVCFNRKTISVVCHSCSKPNLFAEKHMLDIDLNQVVEFNCTKCKEKNYVKWRLSQMKRND